MQQFLIVTPCLNGAHYIDDTIMSVVSQSGDFSIRYHVQDGGSTDDTVERLKGWEKRLAKGSWLELCHGVEFSFSSDSDDGLYDAINKGLACYKEIPGHHMMTWINAGDRLAPGALQTVTSIRRTFPDVEWTAGCFAHLNEEGCPFAYGYVAAVSQKAIAAGIYDGRRIAFLQQEGVFWSSALWSALGGEINPKLKLAGDFDLWRKLAIHAPCHGINSATGFFRLHSGGLSSDLDKYFAEVDNLLAGEEEISRDHIFNELRQLSVENNPENLAKAGFVGPIIMWNTDAGCWERKMALVKYREPAV